MMGVLKGSTWFSILQVAGLCVALVPFGITVLRDGPRPSPRTVVATLTVIGALIVIAYLLGQAG